MWRLGLATGVVVYAVDQLSKLVLIDHLQEVGREVVIPGLFNLVMVWNPGISFGLWRDGAAGWVLVTVALIVVAALAVWLWRTRQPRPALAIGMIIGGAVGNVTDRIAYSAVADFFDFPRRILPLARVQCCRFGHRDRRLDSVGRWLVEQSRTD